MSALIFPVWLAEAILFTYPFRSCSKFLKARDAESKQQRGPHLVSMVTKVTKRGSLICHGVSTAYLVSSTLYLANASDMFFDDGSSYWIMALVPVPYVLFAVFSEFMQRKFADRALAFVKRETAAAAMAIEE